MHQWAEKARAVAMKGVVGTATVAVAWLAFYVASYTGGFFWTMGALRAYKTHHRFNQEERDD